LLVGELTYDHFVSECSQATAIDLPAMIEAVATLVEDESLRERMGGAGRRRALEHYAWPRIIGAYERLWDELDRARREYAAAAHGAGTPQWCGAEGPAIYPAPERSFAGYPSRILDDRDRLVAGPRAGEALEVLLTLSLTNHAPGRRPADPGVLRAAIDRAPCSVADLDRQMAEAGVGRGVGRASIAWLLKYDLLRVVRDDRATGVAIR
jgi:hypothetical protein